MKMNRLLVAMAVLLLPCSMAAAPDVTLRVLNPRGEITLPPVTPPSARIADLAGKRIALYWNGKAGGDHFWNQIERLLAAKLPGTAVVRYQGAFDLRDELAQKIARETDAFLYGVGD